MATIRFDLDSSAAVSRRGSEELEQPQRGLACGTAAAVGERGRLSVGEAFCMIMMEAASGGYGVQAKNWPLADGTGFLPCAGLPQLENAMTGEPVDLTDFQGIVLGAT